MLVLGLAVVPFQSTSMIFLPDARIETIELDPGVIDVAKNIGLRETNRFHLTESDGRVYLKRHTELYGLIMVDAFTGSYIPFHLMTREFYQLVRDRLAPHGVAAFNIIPSVKLFDSNVRTLKLAFNNLSKNSNADSFAHSHLQQALSR